MIPYKPIMNIDLIVKIILGVGIPILSVMFWFSRNWISEIVTTLSTKIDKIDKSIEDVKDIQTKQAITMTKIQSTLDNTKQRVESIDRHVEDHNKRLHAVEVEQARISQWKKDKEEGV